ncbi:MAG: F0F1 ATP synthase subunit A [Myxococcales bacterium]|nr:F0F1 ATP synthase subunit A [Myxococcales bacterium]
MPHGHSWFSFLPFYEDLYRLANNGRQTWIAHSALGIQHVLAFVFVLLLLVLCGLAVKRRFSDVQASILPSDRLTIPTTFEIITSTSYAMIADIFGDRHAARYFLPLIGACAFVILVSNALGLVPGFAPPTDNLNTTFAMAIIIFIATHVYGIKKHGVVKYAKHFMGPFLPLAVLMVPIELISHIARPVTLAIRLMANMTADHLVLGIFLGLVPFVVPLPMYVLGCIVVLVQTLVFCLLSAVYIALAIEDHGDGH